MYQKYGKIAGKIQFRTGSSKEFLDINLWVKGNDLPPFPYSVPREILTRMVSIPRSLSHRHNGFATGNLQLNPTHLLQLKERYAQKAQAQIEENSCVSDDEKKTGKLKQVIDQALTWAEEEEERDNIKPNQELQSYIISLKEEIDNLKQKLLHQSKELKACHNQVLELKGSIRVFCRCRPLTPNECKAGDNSVIEFNQVLDNELYVRTHDGAKKTFKFDHVFTPSHTQEEVFLETAPLVVSVLDGFNVCIFAYGQTGTGKTFTMEGTEQNRGVNYRTLEKLFQLASQRKGQYTYEIFVSVLEVYNEEIRDLLATSPALGQNNKKLEIKQCADGMHHVPGVVEEPVHNIEEVWKVLQTGSKARAIGSTNANKHSSRSHCLLCVMVKGENVVSGEHTKSKLWLIDLAGSERIGKTDVQGERLKEAQNINKSLSALGDVIHSLTSKSSHIPYRNSKITHLLQDSLGGQSKTLMFVHVSPSEQDVGETLCTLNFATRVRGVELGAARKQLDPAELMKYKKLVERGKEDILKKDAIIMELQGATKMKEHTCKTLSAKVKESEGLLQSERKARVAAEEKLKEQTTLAEKQRMTIQKLTSELKLKQSGGLTEIGKPEKLPAASTPSRPPLRERFGGLTETGKPEKLPAALTPSRPPLRERLLDNFDRTNQSNQNQGKKRSAEEHLQKENICSEGVVLHAKSHRRRVSLSVLQHQEQAASKSGAQEETNEEHPRSRRRGRASMCVLPQRCSTWAFPTASCSPNVKFTESRTYAADPVSLDAEKMQIHGAKGRSSMVAHHSMHFRPPYLPLSGVIVEREPACNEGAMRVSNFSNMNVTHGKPPQHPHQSIRREFQYQPKRIIRQNGDKGGHHDQPPQKSRRLSGVAPDLDSCHWELPNQRQKSIGRFSMVSPLPWGAAHSPSAHPFFGGALRVPLSASKPSFSGTKAWHR
ncbi:hypothetical protein KP509_37G051500 [Ceratopteris richardii]|nr:hypothetical protein KP509_37G051500 [Ceratopteris richardii]